MRVLVTISECTHPEQVRSGDTLHDCTENTSELESQDATGNAPTCLRKGEISASNTSSHSVCDKNAIGASGI